MAKPIRISIQTSFDAAGANQAQAALAALQKAAQQAARAPAGAGPTQGYQQQTKAAQQAAMAAQKLATEQGRTATTAAQAATAAQKLATETQRTATAQNNAQKSALQLAAAQERAARSAQLAGDGMKPLPRTIAGLSHEAANFAKVAAGAFVVNGLAAFAKDAIDSANGLETVKASLRAVAGDTASYEKILAVAAENQRLFGGSMQESIEDMTAFAVSSRTAGVDMEQLVDVAKRLALFDPGQGLKGANVALRELLSGNEKSLAMRFELPASALRTLGDETLTATEKLAGLDAFLNDVGLTSEVLATRAETTAQSWRDLGNAASNLKDSLGGLLAEGLQPVAEAGAGVLNWVNEGISALQNFGGQLAATKGNALEGAASYEEYQRRIESVRDALAEAGWQGVASEIETLSKAQYEWAQSLIAGGMAAGDAYAAVEGMSAVQQEYAEGLMAGGMAAAEATAAAREYGTALDAVNSVQGKLWDDAGASSDQLATLGDTMLEVASASDESRAQVEALAQQYLDGEISSNQLEDAVLDLQAAQVEAAAAAAEEAAEQQALTDAKADADAQSRALADSLAAQATATDDSTAAGVAQKAALEAAGRAAQDAANDGKGLEDQARAAADALWAAGAAGMAAAGQLAGSSSDVDRLTAAYYRLQAARMAAGGTGAASALGNVGRPTGTGKGTPAAPTSAKGVAADLVAGQAGAFKPPSGGRGGGGGGGGGGGSSRQSEAQKAQERLAEIASDGGARIAEITEETAAKLVEIDRDAAAERARIAEELSRTLQTDAASGLAEREANDLDLVGETDKKRLAQLQAREKAEKEAAERMAAAQQEARDKIAAGEVEAAEAQYEAQKDYIADRQELDQSYYEKQAELAGNPEALAELDKQYQEAVKALDDAAKLEQEIAAAKAQAKIQAVNDEKAAVIAAADEQKAEVVKRAQDQAAGVKGASEAQRLAVVSDLGAQAQAATDWASATEKAAGRAAEAYRKAAEAAAKVPAPGSGSASGSDAGAAAGGGTKAAGGGTFVTSRPTTLTVGDNPGGVELVTVTPLSGRGSTSVGPGMARMAGGGSLLAGAGGLLREIAGSGVDPEAAEGYAASLRSVLDALESVRRLAGVTAVPAIDLDLVWGAAKQAAEVARVVGGEVAPLTEEIADGIDRQAAAMAGIAETVAALSALSAGGLPPPLPPGVVEAAAREAARVVAVLRAELVPLSEATAEDIGRYLDAAQGAIGLLEAQRGLADAASYRPPVSETFIRQLAEEARQVAAVMLGQLIPLTEEQTAQARRFGDLTAQAIQTITQTAALGRELQGYRPPVHITAIRRIAEDAVAAARQFEAAIIPATQSQVDGVSRYAALVGAAVQGLTGVLDLRTQIAASDVGSPIDRRVVDRLADEAATIADVFAWFSSQSAVRGAVADGAQAYGSAVEAAVSALARVAELRAMLAEGVAAPVDRATVNRLADEADMIASVVAWFQGQSRITAGLAEDIGTYAGAVGDAASALGAVAELRRGLAEPQAPIRAADVERLAAEARMVTQVVQRALLPTSEEQADAVGRYASAVSASVGVIRDTLGLTSDMFADYRPPSSAQIGAVARDAQRIAAAFQQASKAMAGQGLDGAQALADAASSSVQAVRESLLTMQAINDQTFELNPQKLQQFVRSGMQLYDAVTMLGARAVTIPQANLAAMVGAAEAVSAQAQALTALSAVPFDNAMALAGGLAGGGTTINLAPGAIVVNAAPGMDVRAVADAVVGRLNTQIGGRR